MINGPEETLVEALKKVDVHGDVVSLTFTIR